MRLRLFVLAAMIAAATASSSQALEDSKSMQCERYQVSDVDGRKTHVFTYSITANYENASLSVNLIQSVPEGFERYDPELHGEILDFDGNPLMERESNKFGNFPLAVGSDWQIIWHSDDKMRAVAIITRHSDNVFDSPVIILDVDFANVRSRHREAGGFVDLDEVVHDPWKYECRRLD